MADIQRDILLKLKFDTGEVESQVESLKGSIQDIADVNLQSFDKLKTDLKDAEKTARAIGAQFGTNTKEFETAKNVVDGLRGKITEVNKSLNGSSQPIRNLAKELRLAEREAIAIGEAIGTSTPEFRAATERVLELREAVGDVRGILSNLDDGNVLKGVQGFAQGAIGAVQGLAGAFTLLGVDAENANVIIAKLQGLQAIASAVGSIDEISDAFKTLTLQLGLTNAANRTAAGGAALNTAATAASGVAAEAASVSFITLRTVLISLGIGAIIVAVGTLIANFDKLTNSLGLTNANQKSLNEAFDEGKKKAIEVATSVKGVQIAFDQARAGVISKKDALRIYNDTLGDALGRTNDFATAEDNLNKKAKAYIEVARLKAEANLLIAKSAEAAIAGSTAGLEDQTTFFDKLIIGFNAATGSISNAATQTINRQLSGIKRVRDESAQTVTQLDQIAIESLNKAAELESKFGITTGKPGAGATKTAGVPGQTDEQRANEENQKRINQIIRENEIERTAQSIKNETDRQRAILELQFKFAVEDVNRTKATEASKQALIKQLREKLSLDLIALDKKAEEQRAEAIRQIDSQLSGLRTQNELKNTQTRYTQVEQAIRERENKLLEEINNNAVLKEEEKNARILEVLALFAPQYAEARKALDREILDQTIAINNQLFDEAGPFSFAKRKNIIDQNLSLLEDAYKKGKISDDEYTKAIQDNQRLRNITWQQGAVAFGQIAQSISGIISQLADASGKDKAKQKRLQIAAAIVNTLGGIGIALGSAPPPLNFINAGLVAAAGFLNVDKIRKTPIDDGTKNYDSGGSVSTPSLSGIGGTPALTQTLVPSAVQNVRVVNQQGQATIRAYITQDDLRTSQEKSDFLNKLSGF